MSIINNCARAKHIYMSKRDYSHPNQPELNASPGRVWRWMRAEASPLGRVVSLPGQCFVDGFSLQPALLLHIFTHHRDCGSLLWWLSSYFQLSVVFNFVFILLLGKCQESVHFTYI